MYGFQIQSIIFFLNLSRTYKSRKNISVSSRFHLLYVIAAKRPAFPGLNCLQSKLDRLMFSFLINKIRLIEYDNDSNQAAHHEIFTFANITMYETEKQKYYQLILFD